jgi:GTP-binding protein
LVTNARFVAASATGDLPPPTGIEIAFAGRSNVGKSSLLNGLAGRRSLARTSSTPGCTRQITMYEVDFADRSRLTLVDLPGYGYAKRSKAERAAWGPLIENYIHNRPSLRAVVVLVDARRGFEDDDRQVLDLADSPALVSRHALGTLVVATKIDKIGTAARPAALNAIRRQVERPVVGFSARDAETRPVVWSALRKITGLDAVALSPK